MTPSWLIETLGLKETIKDQEYAPVFAVCIAETCAAFAFSTAAFHCLTISFERSEMGLVLWVLSFPTAKPILLS